MPWPKWLRWNRSRRELKVTRSPADPEHSHYSMICRTCNGLGVETLTTTEMIDYIREGERKLIQTLTYSACSGSGYTTACMVHGVTNIRNCPCGRGGPAYDT